MASLAGPHSSPQKAHFRDDWVTGQHRRGPNVSACEIHCLTHCIPSDTLHDGRGPRDPVGEGVCEMRIGYGPGYRVYFVTRGAALVVLLGGGDKRTQSRDIANAIALARSL